MHRNGEERTIRDTRVDYDDDSVKSSCAENDVILEEVNECTKLLLLDMRNDEVEQKYEIDTCILNYYHYCRI